MTGIGSAAPPPLSGERPATGGGERPTVLIIAHRLSSIDACQTLLVMDAGTLLEQGSPAALRAKPNSKFAAMAAANVL